MLQYNNSPTLQALINNLITALYTNPITNNPQNYLQFCNDWLNIDTCSTEGLNNWGRILNFGRSIEIADYGGIFGIPNTGAPLPVDTDVYPQNLNHGTFYNQQASKANRFNLSDSTYRIALKFQYCKTVSDGSVYLINKTFSLYFAGRDVLVYVLVPSHNVYHYVFNGAFDSVTNVTGYTKQERLLFGADNHLGLLPTPLATQELCIYNP